eukprot:484610-Rhodomonas_salina.3
MATSHREPCYRPTRLLGHVRYCLAMSGTDLAHGVLPVASRGLCCSGSIFRIALRAFYAVFGTD